MIRRMKKCLAWMMVAVLASVFVMPAISRAEGDSLKVGSDSIVIDGYYDDWEGMPVTEITYLANNAVCVHEGNIYCDGENLYVHISMNDMYQNQIRIQSFYLKVNDKEVAIPILGVKEDGSIDWDVPIYDGLSEGTHTNLGVFLGYYTACDNDVALTIYDAEHASDDTKGDEIEFRISMKDITKYFGIEADSIDTIAVRNPNIGGEELIYAGSPTGPIAGAAAGFLFVAGIVGAREYKKKRKSV